MIATVYLKSGQTIELTHVESINTRRDAVTDEITSYTIRYEEKRPKRYVNLLVLLPSQIVAITTREQ